MAWYPNAIRRELPQNARQARIIPRSVALHTAVSNATSLYGFFNGRSNGVESHFFVREDGTVEQYIDTARRADCQLDGNAYAISIETWDGAGRVWDGRNVNRIPEWNARQVDALVDLMAWICRTHSIPAAKCPAWNGRGIGYHQQFTGGTRRWNESHACPGPARIRQVPSLIAQTAAALSGGTINKADTPAGEQYARFPGEAWFRTQPRDPLITAMGQRLVAVGCGRYSEGPGPQWSDADRQSYAEWQHNLGYEGSDADGWPGEESWDRLQVPNPAHIEEDPLAGITLDQIRAVVRAEVNAPVRPGPSAQRIAGDYSPELIKNGAPSSAYDVGSDARTRALVRAVAALADGMPDTVRDAVHEALKDAVVDVDVNVTQPGKDA